MSNAWLTIPLADYEGHMAELQQLEALSDLFAEALARCRPQSVAVLGVAGGNGLDRIDDRVTNRIVGIDVNPVFLDEVRRRYARKCKLDLLCIDLAEQRIDFEAVALVHAALVFEHAGVDRCIENALSLVKAGGALSVVLQLPSSTEESVGVSKFASILRLKAHFTLVDPRWLCRELEKRSLHMIHEEKRSVLEGKSFWLGIFAR